MASFAAIVALPVGPQQVLLASSSAQKKGFLDWLSDALDKAELNETDPLLKKVEGKNGSAAAPKPAAGGKKAASPQKKGGFGLFGKK